MAGQTDYYGAGRYDLWILKLDENGNEHGPVGISDSNSSFKGFSLSQNYPNPFNPSTTIRFNLPKSSFVTLTVYNILGKEIEILIHRQHPPGEFKAEWTAKDLSSGIYFYRLQAGQFVEIKKFVLQK